MLSSYPSNNTAYSPAAITGYSRWFQQSFMGSSQIWQISQNQEKHKRHLLFYGASLILTVIKASVTVSISFWEAHTISHILSTHLLSVWEYHVLMTLLTINVHGVEILTHFVSPRHYNQQIEKDLKCTCGDWYNT